MHEASRIRSVVERAVQAEREDQRREAFLPHVVECVDVVTGTTSFSGLYRNRAAAKLAADYEAALESGPDSRLAFEVKPVFPPLPARTIIRHFDSTRPG